MSFLGISLASVITKCTGSTALARNATIVMMPLIIIIGSIIGASVGGIVVGIPGLFAGFVAFGVVALTALACQELIPEAKEAEEENGSPIVSAPLFAGIFVILMLSRYLD